MPPDAAGHALVEPASGEAGHDTSDLSGATLALVVLGLGVTVACVIALMLWLLGGLQTASSRTEVPLTPQQVAPVAPPPPNLQAAPEADIAAVRQHDAALLEGYAWLDPGHARARIPIARAMQLLVGKTLEPLP